MQVANKFNATVVDMRWVKPVDQEMVLEVARCHELLVTVEENVVEGGAGAAINELLVAEGLSCSALNLGLPAIFQEHGSQKEQRKEAKICAESIAVSISVRLEQIGRVASQLSFHASPVP